MWFWCQDSVLSSSSLPWRTSVSVLTLANSWEEMLCESQCPSPERNQGRQDVISAYPPAYLCWALFWTPTCIWWYNGDPVEVQDVMFPCPPPRAIEARMITSLLACRSLDHARAPQLPCVRSNLDGLEVYRCERKGEKTRWPKSGSPHAWQVWFEYLHHFKRQVDVAMAFSLTQQWKRAVKQAVKETESQTICLMLVLWVSSSQCQKCTLLDCFWGTQQTIPFLAQGLSFDVELWMWNLTSRPKEWKSVADRSG